VETLQDRLADALFSYSLSVLCDQDEAVAAVRQTRRLAVRHERRLRRPELERAWLYALARYVCLVRLEARAAAGAARQPVESASARSRLARLAWPEAAGTTPDQREALELAGRHSLENGEIAAVLGLRVEAVGVLLTQGVCEVERTAAALAVLGADACPELSRLGRGRGPVLGRALRNELVRHLDDCPTCRGTAERGAAEGPWPGTFRAAGSLPLVHLPRAALRAAGALEDAPEPRFDRRGFPQYVARVRPTERVGERDQVTVVRQRAVLGSVAAAVVAGPAVALWAVHPGGGASSPAAQVTSVRVTEGTSGEPGATAPGAGDPSGAAGALPSSGVTTTGGGRLGENIGFTITSPSPSASSAPGGAPGGAQGGGTSPGQLQVGAAQSGDRTVITLTNTGGSALMWTASTDAPWLRLSRDGGTLAPGAQLTVLVSVDESRAPADPWSARIVLSPSGAVVTLSGPGTRRGVPSPSPTPTFSPTSSPTPASPTPTPTPSGTPTPSPTPTPTPSTSGSQSGAPSASPSASLVTASP
jgi:DNA-directed RNA polymerase specialized sigma24 family protein